MALFNLEQGILNTRPTPLHNSVLSIDRVVHSRNVTVVTVSRVAHSTDATEIASNNIISTSAFSRAP